MARAGAPQSTIGRSRTDKATRERVARQRDQQRGYAMVSDGFTCVTCEHHEAAPRDERSVHPYGSDEWQAEYDANVEARGAAAERIAAHVATERRG